MTTAKAGMHGHPPIVKIEKIQRTEVQKYVEMWKDPAYRIVSPGEESAQIFLSQAKPLPDSTCIDFGCGTGRGGLMIALFGNMVVTLLDFAYNALDEEVKNATITQPHRISWVEADLNNPIPAAAAYGYCTDVMEHIPLGEVDRVLQNILQSANHVFFQISTVDDVMGETIGETLHMTVKPYSWWLKKLRKLGVVVHWSQNYDDQMCQFYISSWVNHNVIEIEGSVNTAAQQVFDNMRCNAKTDYLLTHPHPLQDTEIMMICGGPSLNDFEDEIIEERSKGMPMITCNGTYNWAIERGMNPSLQLVIDAREFNKRFVQPVVDDCKYMLASQCHPSMFEGLPLDRTHIWHAAFGEEASDLLDELYEIWFPVPGGSTVTLRGLCLLRMLGFHKIHMYGFDSCYREEDHHAYSQPENDYGSKPIPVAVGGRVFWCDAWMFTQAKEWMDMIGMFGDEIELDVKGDGLIAHIIQTGAALSALEENEE